MAEVIRNDAIGLLQAADELELTVFLDYIQDELVEKHVDWINKSPYSTTAHLCTSSILQQAT